MAKEANPTVVGGFVVGGVVLAIAGILIFGGGGLFEKEIRVVAHFESSVAGLDVGAPVRFRGVEVGTVADIRAVWDPDGATIRIPVELRLVQGRVQAPMELQRNEALEDMSLFLEYMVRDLGMRAELQQDSFVTGKLFVALEFRADTPIERVGGTRLLEIPTTAGGIQKLKKSIEDIPIEETINEIRSVVRKLESRLADERIGTILENVKELTVVARAELSRVSDASVTAMEDLRTLASTTESELEAVSKDLRSLLETADTEIVPLAASASGALHETRSTMARIDAVLGEEKTLYRLADLLEEMTGAARSIRVLAEYLERHPEALLSGKDG